jgi:hypothetical protein
VVAVCEGRLFLRATDGAHDFVCTVFADGRAELWLDGQMADSGVCEKPLAGGARHVLLSLVDRSCLLAIDGHTILQFPFDQVPASIATSRPFGLAADGLLLEVDRLQVWRDVYYGPPAATGAAAWQPVQLAKDEFFVLSDNSPLGLDNRYAEFGPAVPAKLFVGKPFVSCGGSDARDDCRPTIQVPGLYQIRYIR